MLDAHRPLSAEVRLSCQTEDAAEPTAAGHLTEGRLTVKFADGWTVRAFCRDGRALLTLGYKGGRWFCSCGVPDGCSHLRALQLVTRVLT